jgi:hypothetical protein
MSEQTGLQIAQFQYVDIFGATQNALMTWAGADINYGKNGSIRFDIFENEAEWQRDNRKQTFVMPITAEDVLLMFQQTGNVALEISNLSWQMAQERRFISSRIEEDGVFKMTPHSLTELNAEIIDVGIPDGLS